MTTPELEAIRCKKPLVDGHKDINLGTLQVTYRPELSSFLSNGTSDGRTLHFTLGVDNLEIISLVPGSR